MPYGIDCLSKISFLIIPLIYNIKRSNLYRCNLFIINDNPLNVLMFNIYYDIWVDEYGTFNYHYTSKMEKISWKPVRQNDRNGNIPSLRWGHSCCVIDD